MKSFKLIIVAICVSFLALFLLGAECGVVPEEVSYYIMFKVNDVQKVFDKGATNWESKPFGQTITGDPDFTNMYANPNVETGDETPFNEITIDFYGTSTGTYTGTVQAQLAYYENGVGWRAYSGTDDIIVTVTRCDTDVGGVIEGTFSTTIYELVPDGVTKVITEGKFKVKRIADNTIVPD
ncbi:MAG: hypothetical protein JSV25_14010 [Spirochaetota bacterium]|nr:MAG: hypothetical protein JSV25_14010 [Spirochaetota bacterium]